MDNRHPEREKPTVSEDAGSGPIGPPGRKGNRNKIQLLRVAVSIGLIAVVFFSLDLGELRQSLAGVSVLTIVVMVMIDLALRLHSAFRWHVLFRAVNPASSMNEITRITFVSSFLGQGLPGAIGVEALRVYYLARSQKDWAGAFASVLADRLFGLVSLGVIICIGIVLAPPSLQSLLATPLLIMMAALLLLTVVAVIPTTRRCLESAFPTRVVERMRSWIDNVYRCIDVYKSSPSLVALSFVFALAFQFGRVMLFYIAARMLGQSPDFSYFLAIVPTIMVASLLPVSIGGLGVREAGIVFLFGKFDVMDSAHSFTLAVLVYLSGILSTIPGGWIYLRDRKSIAGSLKKGTQ